MSVSSLVGARALPQATVGNWPVAIPFRNWEADASRWLQLERVNLIAAFYAAEKFDSIIALKLAQALLPYLENRSSRAELNAVLKAAERAASRLDNAEAAMAVLYYRGRVARLSGNPAEAIGALRDSAQYFLAAGKNAEASEILLTLGQTYRENRHLSDAAEALATAFQIRLAGHDRAGAAGVLIEIAVIVKEHGRYEDAAHILQFAISLITEDPATAQSEVRLAWAHENLGATLKHLGRADEAAIHHRASLAVFTRFGHLRGQAYAMRNLGDLALQAGALREAGEKYTRSLLLFSELGDRRGRAQALAHLGMVQLRTGHWLRAASALTHAAFLARRSGNLKILLRQLRSANPQETPGTQEPNDDPQLTRLVHLVESARKIDP
jgi:tetratricopeptide (TPR) repeat protein